MTVRIAPRPLSAPVVPVASAPVSAQVSPVAADRFERAAVAPALTAPAATQIPSRFELGSGQFVPNGFKIETSGAFPPKPAGSFWTKLREAAMTADNSLKAMQSINSGNTSPSDTDVASQLKGLGVTGMYKSVQATHADYTSTIPDCDPSTVYQKFVNNPAQVFAAGGLTVRPAVNGPLQDGQRLMLQAPGTPALWMPIEVHLDAKNNAIHILTLDGHPFRGTNDFQFASDGNGGTTIAQKSAFQGSSDLIKTAGSGQLDEQHQTWKGVHEFLYTQCAGTKTPAGAPVHVSSSPNAPIPEWDETSDPMYVKSTDMLHSAQLNLHVANAVPGKLKLYVTNDSGQIVRLDASQLKSDGHGGVTGSFDIGATLKGQSSKGYWTLYVGGAGVTPNAVLTDWSLDLNKASAAGA